MFRLRVFHFVIICSFSAFSASALCANEFSTPILLPSHQLSRAASFSSSDSQPSSEFHTKALEECFLSATELGLTVQQAIRLCTHAKSLDPVRCFKEVFQALTNDQKISLCQGANSLAPADCFYRAGEFNLTFDQRIKLCNSVDYPTSSASEKNKKPLGPILCFKQSTNFPISQDERIILCAQADSANPVRCLESAQHLGLSLDQLVHLCTQLSPSSW